MAIDLNKSHYNSEGQKIRAVYPEKESPEIYPQREIYPKREIKAAEDMLPAVREEYSAAKTAEKPKANHNFIITLGAVILAAVTTISAALFGMSGADNNGSMEEVVTGVMEDTDRTGPTFEVCKVTAEWINSVEINVSSVTLEIMWEEYNPGYIKAYTYGSLQKYFSSDVNDGGILSIDSENIPSDYTGDRRITLSLPSEYKNKLAVSAKGGRVLCEGAEGGNVVITGKNTGIQLSNMLAENTDITVDGDSLIMECCTGDVFSIEIKSGGAYLNSCTADTLKLTKSENAAENALMSVNCDFGEIIRN